MNLKPFVVALGVICVMNSCRNGQAEEAAPPRMQGPPGNIVVEISGFRNENGQVLVALFASSNGFPDDGEKALTRISETIRNGKVTVTFPKVPAATYAIAVLHDEDKDFKMKTGFLGMPKEGYAVSGNIKGRFGPPSFSDAKFVVNPKSAVKQTLRMIYL